MERRTWPSMLTYAALALATIGYGLLTYSHLGGLYPGPNVNNPPAAFAWYAEYGAYLKISSVLLVIALGLIAAINVRGEGRAIKSLVFLGSGWLLTAMAYGVLPRYYPSYGSGDDFRPWLLFMAYGAYPAIGAWLFGTLVLWLRRRRTTN